MGSGADGVARYAQASGCGIHAKPGRKAGLEITADGLVGMEPVGRLRAGGPLNCYVAEGWL